MEIVVAPDPRLRIKTKTVNKVTPELLKVAKEMMDFASTFKDPEGVGLSTTQIGRSEKFFVAKFSKKFVAVFNPEIINFADKTRVFFEGCLSVPDYYGETKRAIWVDVSFIDEKGKKIKKRLTGTSSWIFQHETDHLNGILFMDRVLEQKGKIYKAVGKDRAGDDVFEEIKLI